MDVEVRRHATMMMVVTAMPECVHRRDGARLGHADVLF